MVAAHFPCGRDQVRDLDQRELGQALGLADDLHSDGVFDAGTGREERNVEQSSAVFVPLRRSSLVVEDRFRGSSGRKLHGSSVDGQSHGAPYRGAIGSPSIEIATPKSCFGTKTW